MSRRELHELGDLQRQVIETLWKLEEGTVHDVLAALGSDHAYTTVLSVLQKLEKAGWVAHTKQGRTYVWRSARSRDEERQSSLGAVVDRLFRGNPVVAFQHLLDDERLGEKELAELRKLIETKAEELGR